MEIWYLVFVYVSKSFLIFWQGRGWRFKIMTSFGCVESLEGLGAPATEGSLRCGDDGCWWLNLDQKKLHETHLKRSLKMIWKCEFFFWTSIILKEFPWYEIQLFFRFMLMLPWSMELGMCHWLSKRPLKTPKASMLNSGGQVVSLPSGWDPLKYRISMRICWANFKSDLLRHLKMLPIDSWTGSFTWANRWRAWDRGLAACKAANSWCFPEKSVNFCGAKIWGKLWGKSKIA